MNDSIEKLAKILSVEPDFLATLEKEMTQRSGRSNVLGDIFEENQAAIKKVFAALHISESAGAEEVKAALREATEHHEKELLTLFEETEGANEFEKAANLARRIAKIGKGFFLKKSFGADILRKSRPDNLLTFLGYSDVEELLQKHDVTEIFSALRFIETDAWMHGTFEKAYSTFTAADFEERPIEFSVLGPEWREVAKKFVEKKHHNVSHLKEFGVIFLNPIREDAPGKYIRDFALLFHYFHEVEFYSKLFRRYADRSDFATHLKSLLRGDVRQTDKVLPGEWLIVQRYLFKDNPQDPRLFLPRVNPESMHWFRGERDLANFGAENKNVDWEFWGNLDWVSGMFPGDHDVPVSFDLEDNAMSTVSFLEGKKEYLNYHQREALWTRMFLKYAGGEEAMEQLLIENYEKGSIMF